MKRIAILLSVIFSAFYSIQAYAVLNLELTEGVVSALPIAIVPFAGPNQEGDKEIATVVSNDLQNSGRFKVLPRSALKETPSEKEQVNFEHWKTSGVDNLVIGQVTPIPGGKVSIRFTLLDVFKGQDHQNPVIISETFNANDHDMRRAAHHISDVIYRELIGQRGIFSTRIAYVTVQSRGAYSKYRLEVADMDGYNPKAILISNEPIMSPAWSHNGRKLAYVSFENRRAEIYVADVMTGAREKVSAAAGINGAPAWSPDDKKLALVLSKSGSPKIYTYDLSSGHLKQVTTGLNIDTEPSWAPDGQSLIFTSDRAKGPQIYRVNLATGQTQRLTFSGPYNARASFTPDGSKMVMLHRADEGYTIAIQDLSSGSVQLLTRSGRDESPSVAPNGSMVLFGNEYGVLGMVSTDGRIQIKLPAREGEVRSPAWSGFLG